MTCDCERGGPCRKVTVCHMEDAIKEAVDEAESKAAATIDDLRAELAEAERLLRKAPPGSELVELVRRGK